MTLEGILRDLEGLRSLDLFRTPRETSSGPTRHLVLDGRKLLNFGSNSYLGLGSHPAVVERARKALLEYGTGSGASTLVGGRTSLHRTLEEELARLKGTEDCVLFPSGYQANVGTIPALVGPVDLILSDELNHASIVDGCRLSRAKVVVFPHRNPSTLPAILEENRVRVRRVLLVTDSVFSMDGDVACLPELVKFSESNDVLLYVDDAHATGVLGATGRGSFEHFGLEPKEGEIHMGTLSKALASQGGFVASSKALCDFLRNKVRSFVFTTALPPSSVAAALGALEVLKEEGPRLLSALRRNSKRLREGLRRIGFQVPGEEEVPILPVIVGERGRALLLGKLLEKEGVYAPVIRPPSVPEGSERVRVSVQASHTPEDIEEALGAFERAGRAAGVVG